jgi:hypothetical protein
VTPALYIAIASNVLMLAFAAGGAWALVKQLRKDLNGLGTKVNRQAAESDRKFQMIAIVALEQVQDSAARSQLATRILDVLRG